MLIVGEEITVGPPKLKLLLAGTEGVHAQAVGDEMHRLKRLVKAARALGGYAAAKRSDLEQLASALRIGGFIGQRFGVLRVMTAVLKYALKAAAGAAVKGALRFAARPGDSRRSAR